MEEYICGSLVTRKTESDPAYKCDGTEHMMHLMTHQAAVCLLRHFHFILYIRPVERHHILSFSHTHGNPVLVGTFH